jgi:hypothetical protein
VPLPVARDSPVHDRYDFPGISCGETAPPTF